MTRHRKTYMQLIQMVCRQNTKKTDGITLRGGPHHQQGFRT